MATKFPLITGNIDKSPNVYQEVHAERVRAHTKHGALGNSREDAGWTNAEWLPILMEEVGEVAHELTYDAGAFAHRHANLRKELIQVAAMACAWVDAIDRDEE
jgi:NTP pyrophosphatase (non-canonical NTP hydrolase)